MWSRGNIVRRNYKGSEGDSKERVHRFNLQQSHKQIPANRAIYLIEIYQKNVSQLQKGTTQWNSLKNCIKNTTVWSSLNIFENTDQIRTSIWNKEANTLSCIFWFDQAAVLRIDIPFSWKFQAFLVTHFRELQFSRSLKSQKLLQASVVFLWNNLRNMKKFQ